MKRTIPPVTIPDAINCIAPGNFTQVPNQMLRNPEMSAKAKGILCLLLSNREGWKSYVSAITDLMADGRDSILAGLAELEQQGYLIRIRYRDKDSKQYRGMVWCYTDTPGEFDLEAVQGWMQKYGVEAQLPATTGFSGTGKAGTGKSAPNNTKFNNTKGNKKDNRGDHEHDSGNGQFDLKVPSGDRHITPSMFDKFWELYPRKVNKGKAKTTWEKICNRPVAKRPTWKVIKRALHAQRQSEQWQEPDFIPHPTTWLNQERWLDDAANMKLFKPKAPRQGLEPVTDPMKHFEKEIGAGVMAKAFERRCYLPAKEIFTNRPEYLPHALTKLYKQIEDCQEENRTKRDFTFPSPTSIISEYIEWIADSDWLLDKSLNLLDIEASLFTRFRREEATKDPLERDPITGKSYMRE
jgi:hypothetical protein